MSGYAPKQTKRAAPLAPFVLVLEAGTALPSSPPFFSLELPLASVPATHPLHGPCRCPELAKPLQASGGRYINIMLSFL